MGQLSDIEDSDVQYIATQGFLNNLLSRRDDVPVDVLDIMDERYDLITDPGADKTHRKGFRHESEWEFMREYRDNRDFIDQHADDLKSFYGKDRADDQSPFYLIAMALRRSPQGKTRIVLTDDLQLERLCHSRGIRTMRSPDFIRKMQRDRVLDDQGREIEGPPTHLRGKTEIKHSDTDDTQSGTTGKFGKAKDIDFG